MRTVVLAAASLALLASCGPGEDPEICKPPPSTAYSVFMRDQGPPAEIELPHRARTFASECVHRHAYQLASSDEPLDVVAEAVLTACEDPVESYLAAESISALKRQEPSPQGFAAAQAHRDRVEVSTMDHLRRLARLKVIEGRAGRCRSVVELPSFYRTQRPTPSRPAKDS